MPQIKNKLELIKSFRFIIDTKKNKRYTTKCSMESGYISYTIVDFHDTQIMEQYSRCIFFLKNYIISESFEEKLLLLFASVLDKQIMGVINQYDREFIYHMLFSSHPFDERDLKILLEEIINCPEEDLVDLLVMLKLKM